MVKENACGKSSGVVGLAGQDQEWWSGWRFAVGVRESHGGGCIDCVRLVRREEVRRDRERTIEERDVDEEGERGEDTRERWRIHEREKKRGKGGRMVEETCVTETV